MKLKTNVLLIIGFGILCVSILLGTLTYSGSENALKRAIFQEKMEQLNRVTLKIKESITEINRDIFFLIETPSFENLIHFDPNKIETQKEQTHSFWLKSVADLFVSLIKNKPEYLKIRYINEKGQEEILVQSEFSQDPLIVSQEKLQNNASENYFKITMQLAKGEIYISPLNLYREFDKIVVPYQPIIRIASPLFDSEGNRKGISIINVSVERIFTAIQTLPGDIYLLNENGYFLKHPDISKEFGFEFEKDYRIQKSHLQLAKNLQDKEEFVAELQNEKELKVSAFKKLYYNDLNHGNYWTLLIEIPVSEIFAPIQELRERFLWLAGGLMIFVLFFVYILKMSRNLQEVLQEVQGGTNVLAASVSQILTSSQQLTTSTTETSTSISEATSSLEELKQTAELSSKKAKNVLESSEKATRITQDGKKAVEESIGRMNHIREQMGIIAESVTKLSEQSQTIGEITTSVNELAEQSNLLSVNASIEAAKAGEHGKGFAVVAQEIKNLAQQSKQATAQVRSILNDIQKSIHHSVELTREGNKAVEIGVKQSLSAGESIQILSQSVHESAQVASQIVVSSQQELAGIEQIVIAMKQIQEASSQNLGASQQSEESMRSLSDLGQKLKQLLGKYK